MRRSAFLILLVAIAQTLWAVPFRNAADQEAHTEIAMRMIGHQVLLSQGDSTSIVLPIDQDGNRYTIRFSSDFSFDPESIAIPIDSVIRATGISENYIVEFIACHTQQVVHGYEIGEQSDVLACQGREQPLGCYEIRIRLMDRQDSAVAEIPVMEQGEEKGDSTLLFLVICLGGATVLFILIDRLLKNRKYNTRSTDSVRMGEFIFKKKSMELLYKEESIALTGKETELLHLLSLNPNDTIERQEILQKVWGDEGDYVGRTLDVFISKLRKKLEADESVRIINIRGIGYKLVLSD